MTKTKAIIVLALVLLAVAGAFLQYRNDFLRVQRVEVAPVANGTFVPTSVLLTNKSSKQLAFALRCYGRVGRGGKMLFSKGVVLQRNENLEFDVYPEFAGGRRPTIIPDRECEATWRGPFGTERAAWQVFMHGARVSKSTWIRRDTEAR